MKEGISTHPHWVHPDEGKWKIWVEYCEKVGRWYWHEPCDPELEPYGMNPPCESIVKGTIYADQNLKSCRMELGKIIEVLNDHSGGKGIGVPHLYAGGVVIENEMLRDKVNELAWEVRKLNQKLKGGSK